MDARKVLINKRLLCSLRDLRPESPFEHRFNLRVLAKVVISDSRPHGVLVESGYCGLHVLIAMDELIAPHNPKTDPVELLAMTGVNFITANKWLKDWGRFDYLPEQLADEFAFRQALASWLELDGKYAPVIHIEFVWAGLCDRTRFHADQSDSDLFWMRERANNIGFIASLLAECESERFLHSRSIAAYLAASPEDKPPLGIGKEGLHDIFIWEWLNRSGGWTFKPDPAKPDFWQFDDRGNRMLEFLSDDIENINLSFGYGRNSKSAVRYEGLNELTIKTVSVRWRDGLFGNKTQVPVVICDRWAFLRNPCVQRIFEAAKDLRAEPSEDEDDQAPEASEYAAGENLG